MYQMPGFPNFPSADAAAARLSNCGILSAIRSNPDIFEPVFTPGHSTQIKPEMFID